jgi:uncharacterized protein
MQNFREPLSGEDLDLLDEYLAQVDGGAIPNIEAFDGFITALAVCPVLVQPSEFLPVIQNGKSKAGSLVFKDLEQAEEFTGLVMRHWNDVNGTLGQDEPHLPIFLADDDGVALGNDWALGFYRGTQLRAELWASMMEDERRAGGLVPILALAFENDPDPSMRPYPKPISDSLREELKMGMAAGALQLYRAFAPERRSMAGGVRPVRSDKVKPNAPCPCGSGKKFKKCCGAVVIH